MRRLRGKPDGQKKEKCERDKQKTARTLKKQPLGGGDTKGCHRLKKALDVRVGESVT